MNKELLNEFIEFADKQGITVKTETSNQSDTFEKIFSCYSSVPTYAEKQLAKLDKLATEIKIVSGCNLEKLLELFLAGYTLKAPEYKSLEEVFNGKTKEEN